MNKILRILAVVLILVLLTFSIVVPVSAISHEPTLLQLNQADAFQYCLESGDMLIFVDFTVTYDDPQPTEPISDTYILRMMSGATEIVSTTPYAFFNNGYNRGVIAIYLTKDEVTTAGLVWGGAYSFKLDGNPLATWTGAVPSATQLNTINWSAATTQGATRLVVEAKIRALASSLQTAWNSSSYILLANYASGGVLTSTGESYFSVIIPNLMAIAPGILSSSSVETEYIDRNYGTDTADAIQNDLTGTPLDMTNLAGVLYSELDPIVITSILALGVLVFIAIKTRDSTKSYKPIVLISIPVIVVLTKMGWISMTITILLCFVAGLMIFYTFFYEKSSQ